MIKISTGLLIYPSVNLPYPLLIMQSMFETIKLSNDKIVSHPYGTFDDRLECPTMANAIKC